MCDFATVDCPWVKNALLSSSHGLDAVLKPVAVAVFFCLMMAGSCSCTSVVYCSCDICVHTLIMRSVIHRPQSHVYAVHAMHTLDSAKVAKPNSFRSNFENKITLFYLETC